LEIALLAWHFQIAWPQLIKEQFGEHVCPQDAGRHPILKTYREANSGDKFYPALAHFIKDTLAGRQKPDPGLAGSTPRIREL
jgi:hypothetical protein